MIGDLIGEWIKGILIDGIMGNLSGLFNTVNTKVGEIASDVGSTPQDWNGGIFSMLQNLSETVIVPIAAAILALVMCYELIDMIVEKNNMHDFDSSMFFRWIFKSAFAILIVTNTWNIVMGVFDATQQVVNQSAGVIIGDTSIDFDTLLPDLESRLEAMDIGPLLGLWFQTLVVGLTMNILSICIFLVTYGRMIEIYAVTALGLPSLSHYGGCRDLCGADPADRNCRRHIRRDLGLYGLYRFALLLSVQDRQHIESRIYRTLTDRRTTNHQRNTKENLQHSLRRPTVAI